jgi:hypothetical protein
MSRRSTIKRAKIKRARNLTCVKILDISFGHETEYKNNRIYTLIPYWILYGGCFDSISVS